MCPVVSGCVLLSRNVDIDEHKSYCVIIVNMADKVNNMIVAVRVDAKTLHKLRALAGAGNFSSVAAYLRSLIEKETGGGK